MWSFQGFGDWIEYILQDKGRQQIVVVNFRNFYEFVFIVVINIFCVLSLVDFVVVILIFVI